MVWALEYQTIMSTIQITIQQSNYIGLVCYSDPHCSYLGIGLFAKTMIASLDPFSLLAAATAIASAASVGLMTVTLLLSPIDACKQ